MIKVEGEAYSFADLSKISVLDLELLTVDNQEKITVDSQSGEITTSGLKTAVFYLHIEHQSGYFVSIKMRALKEFGGDRKEYKLNVHNDANQHFFSFQKSDISKCAELFELGSVETTYLEQDEQFILKVKEDSAESLVKGLKSLFGDPDLPSGQNEEQKSFSEGVNSMLASNIKKLEAKVSGQPTKTHEALDDEKTSVEPDILKKDVQQHVDENNLPQNEAIHTDAEDFEALDKISDDMPTEFEYHTGQPEPDFGAHEDTEDEDEEGEEGEYEEDEAQFEEEAQNNGSASEYLMNAGKNIGIQAGRTDPIFKGVVSSDIIDTEKETEVFDLPEARTP